jgi:hypothetical protein
MRGKIAILVVIVVAAALVLDQSLRVRRGAVITACGWIAPASDADYSAAALKDFRGFLAQHGFQLERRPKLTLMFAGMHSGNETEEWFVGRVGGSLPFHVNVRSPRGGSSGLVVEVVYDYRDYRWRVTATERDVENFTPVITKWWEQYQQQHPGGPPRPNKTVERKAGAPSCLLLCSVPVVLGARRRRSPRR